MATKNELREAVDEMSAKIAAAMAEAARDRQFVEAIIAAMDNGGLYCRIIAEIQEAHERIYGTPCTKEKS